MMMCDECVNKADCEAGKLDPKPQIETGECGHVEYCSRHLTWKDACEQYQAELAEMRWRIAQMRKVVADTRRDGGGRFDAVADGTVKVLDYIETGKMDGGKEEVKDGNGKDHL